MNFILRVKIKKMIKTSKQQVFALSIQCPIISLRFFSHWNWVHHVSHSEVLFLSDQLWFILFSLICLFIFIEVSGCFTQWLTFHSGFDAHAEIIPNIWKGQTHVCSDCWEISPLFSPMVVSLKKIRSQELNGRDIGDVLNAVWRWNRVQTFQTV